MGKIRWEGWEDKKGRGKIRMEGGEDKKGRWGR